MLLFADRRRVCPRSATLQTKTVPFDCLHHAQGKFPVRDCGRGLLIQLPPGNCTYITNRESSGIVAGEVPVSIVEACAGGTQAMRRMYPTRTGSDKISYWTEGGTCELDTAATEVKRTNHH